MTSTASSMAVERVLVDTWGWLALADDHEPRHASVRKLLAFLWRRTGIAVTSDYILDEAFTLVFRRLAFAKARRFVSTLDEGEREGSLQIERIGSERFAQALMVIVIVCGLFSKAHFCT